MSEVYEIADQYVLAYAALDPIAATDAGIAGHEHELTDFSPDASAARDRLDRDTLAALEKAPRTDDRDRIAADVMTERLELSLELHDAGEELRALRIIGSPVQEIRSCFDLMAYDSEHDWEIAAQRLARVPESLASLESALREGMSAGSSRPGARPSGARSRRRRGAASPTDTVLRCARGRSRRRREAARRARARGVGCHRRRTRNSRVSCATSTPRRPTRAIPSAASATRCSRARSTASSSTSTRRTRGVGRSSTASRSGCARSRRILPGETVAAVADHLDHDATRTIEGVDEFRRWNQDLIDQTIAELNGTHFDIAAPLRKCEAMIAPPGRRGGDVLHRPERGLLPARAHVVPDAGPDDVPALARGEHLLPRGRARPSPPGRAGEVPVGAALAVPARVRVPLGPRRGLGAVRRTADGRARLPRRPRVRARHARRRRCARCG